MSWTPGDYLLRNAFCPISDIQGALDDVRRQDSAEWVWLLSYSTTGYVRSLSLFSSDTSRHVPPSYETLESTSGLGHGAGKDTQASVKRALMKKLGLTTANVEAANKHQLVEGTVSFWLISSSALSADTKNVSIPMLAVMISGTLIANSLRDGRISELILNAVEDADSVGWDSTLGSLLELAITVSGADGATFYQFEPTIDSLVMDAEVGSGRVELGLHQILQLQPSDEGTTLAQGVRAAFKRSRSLMHEVNDARARNWKRGANIHAATIPSPLSPLGGLGRNAGVLVVWKAASQRSVSMSWFDMALLRNIALRISLLVSNDRLESSARELQAVISQVTNEDHGGLLRDSGSRRVSGSVPADIFAAREVLLEVADHLWRATKCDSVTVRVLMTTFDSKPRLYLNRFVAVPSERLQMPHPDIDVGPTDGSELKNPITSANAFAARKGVAHIRDSASGVSNQVDGLARVVVVGGRSPRSEIAVPIVVDGMVVGTLNLESSYANSFIPQIQLIEAFAAVAGLAIAMQRRAVVRALAERYALDSEGFHEASKIAELISRSPTEAPWIGDLQSLLSEMESPDRTSALNPRESTRASPLRELLNEQAGVAKLPELKISGAVNLVVKAQGAAVLREVFKELFKNARAHSRRGFPTYISAGEVELASGQYVFLTCRSSPDLPVTNPRKLRSLYRAPMPDPDGGNRLHLGCFTVGEQVRSLKGNVFAGRTRGDLFETHLLLPKETFE